MELEGGDRLKGAQKSSKVGLPLITVITVVLNRVGTIAAAIESVLGQTYPNIEYIVIDGGSTDGTVDVIRTFEEQIDYWLSEKDEGIYYAMNKGISLANGEWVALLNSDDLYINENSLIVLSEIDGQYDIVVSDVIMLTKEGEKIYCVNENRPLYITTPYMHTGMFFRKAIYEKYGFYDTSYMISSDNEYVFRCKKQGLKFYKLSHPLVYMSDGGISSSLFREVRSEYRQIYIKYGGSLWLGWYGYFFTLVEKIAYNCRTIRWAWRLLKSLLTHSSRSNALKQ